DAIDVENSYGKLELRRVGGKWELFRGNSSHAVDDGEVRNLISRLTDKNQVQSFPEPTAKRRQQLGLAGKADMTVTVWADSLEKPEDQKAKKDKKGKEKEKKSGKPKFKKGARPVAVLRFGNVEGKAVAVDRVWGKESTLVMVPEGVREQVRKGPLAYFDRALPS